MRFHRLSQRFWRGGQSGKKYQGGMIIGCVSALAGVAIIVSGSLGEVNLYGDLLALWMAFVMATIMVIYRKYPTTPGAGPAILSSVLLLPAGWLFGKPFEIDRTELNVLSAFGLLFAIASVTLAEGAKRVPSGQTALLSSLEIPLAPVLAYWFLTEIPGVKTVLGGTIVLCAVLSTIKRNP